MCGVILHKKQCPCQRTVTEKKCDFAGHLQDDIFTTVYPYRNKAGCDTDRSNLGALLLKQLQQDSYPMQSPTT